MRRGDLEEVRGRSLVQGTEDVWMYIPGEQAVLSSLPHNYYGADAANQAIGEGHYTDGGGRLYSTMVVPLIAVLQCICTSGTYTQCVGVDQLS